MRMKKLLRAGCLSALATLAGCGGNSSDQPSTSTQSTASTAPAVQQSITLTTQSAGLVQQATPNGKGTMMRLEGRFQSAAIARRNADGSISAECHDEDQAAAAFAQGAGPAKVEVK
jgi:hypothetical protein